MRKTVRLALALACVLSAPAAFSQAAVFVGSLGGGIGCLQENFTLDGDPTSLVYPAPGGYLSLELGYGNWYGEMALAALFCPFGVSLGGDPVDLSGYELNMGVDFTALGIGYLQPIGAGISLGGSIGFHVSAPTLSPPGDDPDRLAFEQNYGLIGLSLSPRLRFQATRDIVLSLNLPIGIDFSPMGDQVVAPGGAIVGHSPAYVAPAGLTPLFTGLTAGAYVSVGFMLPL